MIQGIDILGNIAILKFDKSVEKSGKLAIAREVLKTHKAVKTVLEKSDKIKGRLRTMKTVHLAGGRTKIVNYKENGCLFRFDVDKTYFSPRLSNERKEIAQQVKKKENVLVMFAGVGPYSIVIAKLAKPKIVYSIEINRAASKMAEENVKLNKLDNVVVVQGDVKRVVSKSGLRFDRIVMPRPQLKESFLKWAFKVIKKNGIINYYGFGKSHEEILEEIEVEAKKARRKIKILRVKKAGDIAPFKFRWRVDFKVL